MMEDHPQLLVWQTIWNLTTEQPPPTQILELHFHLSTVKNIINCILYNFKFKESDFMKKDI
jgi:hypothetical protein